MTLIYLIIFIRMFIYLWLDLIDNFPEIKFIYDLIYLRIL